MTPAPQLVLLALVGAPLVSGSFQLSALNEFTASFGPVMVPPSQPGQTCDALNTIPLVPPQIASGEITVNVPSRQVMVTARVQDHGSAHAKLKIDANSGYASLEIVDHDHGVRGAVCSKISFPPQAVPPMPPALSDDMIPPQVPFGQLTLDGEDCLINPHFCEHPAAAFDAASSLPVFVSLNNPLTSSVSHMMHQPVPPIMHSLGLKFSDQQPSAAAFAEPTCVAEDPSASALMGGEKLQALLADMHAPLRALQRQDVLREALAVFPEDLSALAAPAEQGGANVLPFCAGAAVSATVAALFVVIGRARAVKNVDSAHLLA